MNREMLGYVIYVPPYTSRSNGIKVLYHLYDLIIELGRNARLVMIDAPLDVHSETPLKYQQAYSTQRPTDSEIVIYPETIPDNPLHAKNVVRYLLNKPLYLMGKPINYCPTDYLLSYSEYIDQHLNQLFILHPELKKYTPNTQSQKNILVYIGKTRIKPQISKNIYHYFLKNNYSIIVISRGNPKTSHEYLAKLKAACGLITFDALSSVTLEALMCGIPVYMMDDLYSSEEIKIGISMNGLVYNDQDFIDAVNSGKTAGVYEEVCLEIDKNIAKTSTALELIENHFQTVNEFQLSVKFSKSNPHVNRAKNDLLMFKNRLNSIPITAVCEKYSDCDYITVPGIIPDILIKCLSVLKPIVRKSIFRQKITYFYHAFLIKKIHSLNSTPYQPTQKQES